MPARALTDKIIRLYLSPVIADITQIVILSNTDFLVYRGQWSKDEGMSYEEAVHHLRSIVGSRDWVGFPVIVRATPLTLAEGKARITDAREFVRLLTMSKAQLDDAQGQELLRAKEEQERALRMEFARRLETQRVFAKKLKKPRSVYVPPDSSPTRPKPSDDERGDRSTLFDVKLSERSVRSYSLSDLDP